MWSAFISSQNSPNMWPHIWKDEKHKNQLVDSDTGKKSPLSLRGLKGEPQRGELSPTQKLFPLWNGAHGRQHLCRSTFWIASLSFVRFLVFSTQLGAFGEQEWFLAPPSTAEQAHSQCSADVCLADLLWQISFPTHTRAPTGSPSTGFSISC